MHRCNKHKKQPRHTKYVSGVKVDPRGHRIFQKKKESMLLNNLSVLFEMLTSQQRHLEGLYVFEFSDVPSAQPLLHSLCKISVFFAPLGSSLVKSAPGRFPPYVCLICVTHTTPLHVVVVIIVIKAKCYDLLQNCFAFALWENESAVNLFNILWMSGN